MFQKMSTGKVRERRSRDSSDGDDGGDHETGGDHEANADTRNQSTQQSYPKDRTQPQPANMIFNPSMYNLTPLKFKHLPPANIRSAWISWIRWFETIMEASNIKDSKVKKSQMIAIGGLELQDVYFELAAGNEMEEIDPYKEAKLLLDGYFAPQHHVVFERYTFWSTIPEAEEPIEKFVSRIQKGAERCTFGKDSKESRDIAIIDKVIMHAPGELREKLLSKETLALNEMIKIINAHQSVKYQTQQMSN